jgi:hypothetical protein
MSMLGTWTDLIVNGLVFVGNRLSQALSAADVVEEACVLSTRLLLAKMVVILNLPLVTRHPVAGTPGFLEQSF